MKYIIFAFLAYLPFSGFAQEVEDKTTLDTYKARNEALLEWLDKNVSLTKEQLGELKESFEETVTEIGEAVKELHHEKEILDARLLEIKTKQQQLLESVLGEEQIEKMEMKKTEIKEWIVKKMKESEEKAKEILESEEENKVE